MNLSGIFCFVLLSFWITSCYEPDGENFVNVSPPSAEDITLDLTTFNDTVFLYANASVHLLYSGKPALREYMVFVNGTQVGTYKSPDRQFYLSGTSIGTGVHELELRVIAKTNSGSLADRLDAESMLLSKKFVLVVDVTVPDVPTVKIDSTGGVLRVSWDAYTRKNFVEYQFIKECLLSNGNMSTCKSIKINDPAQASFVDEDFLGGIASYRVNIRTVTNYVYSDERFVYSKLGVRVELLSNNKLNLKFTKPTFASKVSAIEVYQQNVLVTTIHNLNDTIVSVENNFKFGSVYEKAFSIVLKGHSADLEFRQDIAFGLGKKFLQSGERLLNIRFNTQRQEYFTTISNYQALSLNVFNSSFERLKEKKYQMSDMGLSEDGEKLYAAIYDGDLYNFCRINPATLDTTRLWRSGYRHSPMQVSNTNLFCARETYYWSVLRVADPGLQRIKVTEEIGNVTALSPDGKYYFDYDRIYSIDAANKMIQIRQIIPSIEADLSTFRHDKPQELLILKGTTIRLINILTGEERTISFQRKSPSNNINYDSQSGWLLYSTNHDATMIHIDTGDIIFVPTVNEVTLNLANGQVISSDGYVADIDFIKSLIQ